MCVSCCRPATITSRLGRTGQVADDARLDINATLHSPMVTPLASKLPRSIRSTPPLQPSRFTATSKRRRLQAIVRPLSAVATTAWCESIPRGHESLDDCTGSEQMDSRTSHPPMQTRSESRLHDRYTVLVENIPRTTPRNRRDFRLSDAPAAVVPPRLRTCT